MAISYLKKTIAMLKPAVLRSSLSLQDLDEVIRPEEEKPKEVKQNEVNLSIDTVEGSSHLITLH